MAKNKVFIGDYTINRPVQDEAPVAADTLPASLVFKDAGEYKATVADGGGEGVMLYVTDLNTLLQGNMTTPWTAGDTSVAFEPRSSERYNVRVAAGQNITALDTPLASNGDGTLRIGVAGTDFIVCYADEIINTGAAEALVQAKF